MDAILFWNDVALEANRVSHTNMSDPKTLGPTGSSRALAIIHLAAYEAYAWAKGYPANLPPYDVAINSDNSISLPAGVSAQAAAAGAAYQALKTLYGTQIAIFDGKLAIAPGVPASPLTDPSVLFGIAVANKILADRQNDPDADNNGYQYNPAKGSHRQDPDNPSPNSHGPEYGARSKGFAITARHQIAPYPALNSQEFRRALLQVKGKGIAPELAGTLNGGTSYRTPEETVIGIYWGYDGASGLGTPPRLYNQIVRQVAAEQNNTEEKNARLFALVNVAMGDAGILAWEEKYRYNLMRPVVGIREGDKSLGETTVGNNNLSGDSDPLWLPLGAPATNAYVYRLKADGTVEPPKKNFTPPFPAYPSGHATFGAAALHVTRLFYNVTGSQPDQLLNGKPFVSDELDGKNRDNNGAHRPRHARNFPEGDLWHMIIENGISRVYLGVHWSFDSFAVDNQGRPDLTQNVGGVPLGLKIAEDIFTAGMKKSSVGPTAVVQ